MVFSQITFFSVLGLSWTDAALAANLKGSEAVLRQAADSSASEKPAEKQSPNEAFRKELKEFAKKSSQLAPAEAAKQWLAFVEQFTALQATPVNNEENSGENRQVTFDEVIEVLPSPAAWGELAKQIEARPAASGPEQLRELGLRLLAHTLLGDTTKRREDLAGLETLAGKAKSSQRYFYNSLYEQLSKSILATMEDPDAVLKLLDRKINGLQSENSYSYQQTIDVPNLVDLVGPEKAEAFFRRVLVKTKVQLKVEENTSTSKMAQKLALELAPQLKSAQWGLVNSLDALDLYEALEKKFGKTNAVETVAAQSLVPGVPDVPMLQQTEPNSEKKEAQIYYLLGLIAHGRTADAVVVAKKCGDEDYFYFPTQAVRQMERAGFTRQLAEFFQALLKQNPELPFWNEYVQLAAHAGQTPAMVELVRESCALPTLSKSQRIRLEQLLHKALLANDEVEKGVAELRKLMTADQTKLPQRARYEMVSQGDLGLQLARIGLLLNQTNWLEEGISAAKAALDKGEGEEMRFGEGNAVTLAKFLMELNRFEEAEAILASALAKASQKEPARESYGYSQSKSANILGALVCLYHKAGRPADVLYLFDNAPGWGVADLAKIHASFSFNDSFDDRYSYKSIHTPLAYYAAAALAGTDRRAEALKLLEPLLNENPGLDRLYELLIVLDETNAPARLDALFARDQFEERPLIWKAYWLRKHQQLEAAEKVARQAISIDPTDGEEGPGDRLRAYAELAEIRSARGDEKETAFLKGVLQSVRESETADRFYSAGLLKHAAGIYEDSLNHFADAYCIHARLAVRLAELGQHEQAEEHYRRAYELMPDSFGRLESYCFGCERAFDGERAQGIAEKVFTELAAKTPNKPQVHYLLGYLREEQSRPKEAIEHYRTAVKLDPDYLNAWLKINEAAEHVFLPTKDRDQVILNIMRLDPLHRHSSPSLELVSDLPGLWRQMAEAAARQPVKPESLYPLAASKAALEKQKEKKSGRDRMDFYSNYVGSQESLSPGKAISENGFVRAAAQIIGDSANSLEF